MRFVFVTLFCLVAAIATAAPLPRIPRSVSTSRQFVIYGTEVPLRGAVADLAERTKATMLSVLQKRDDWKTPIVFNLQIKQANVPELPPSALRFSQTGAGLKIQLDLTLDASVDAAAVQRDILRALFLEMIYRNHADIPAGSTYVEAPDWLLDGVLAMASGSDKGGLAQALTAAGSENKVMSVEQLLAQKPALLDSPARRLYRAYSFALLQLLLNQPAGAARLGAYVENLSRASNDPVADLEARFPSLGSGGDLGAMWQRSVATFAVTGNYQLSGFAESQRQLDVLLQFKMPGSDKTWRLEDFLQVKLTKQQKVGLRRVAESLALLAVSSNPVIRPVVTEYQAIAERLIRGRRGGLAARLEEVQETRKRMAAHMDKIDDYMNWFEATQATSASGAFSDYLKAAAEWNGPQARRRDPLSVYMDAMEVQFQ